jgi:hypothetical protein
MNIVTIPMRYHFLLCAFTTGDFFVGRSPYKRGEIGSWNLLTS